MTDEKYEEVEVIEDSRTGELIPKGSPELRPGVLAQINISQVGTLELDGQAEAVLTEPLDPKDVQIRPDGLVYLPWTWYNKRLNRAFGLLKWALIPQGSPVIKETGNSTLIVWLNWLVIKGIPVAMAGGETSYQPSNYTMSYGDALEGARSNSLARNCKNLGMALELWDAEWVSNWKKEYAEQYTNDKGKKLWRKKGAKAPQTKTTTPSTKPVDDHQKPLETSEQTETVKTTESSTEAATEAKYTPEQLRSAEIVVNLKGMTGKAIPEIMKVINSLDKSGKYSVEEVAKKISG